MMSDKKLDQLLIADEVAKILRIKLDGDFVIKSILESPRYEWYTTTNTI